MGALLSTVAVRFSAFLLKPDIEERRAPLELSGLDTWAGSEAGGGGGGGGGAPADGGGGGAGIDAGGGAGAGGGVGFAEEAIRLLLLFLCVNSIKKNKKIMDQKLRTGFRRPDNIA